VHVEFGASKAQIREGFGENAGRERDGVGRIVGERREKGWIIGE